MTQPRHHSQNLMQGLSDQHEFVTRHNGPAGSDQQKMLATIGVESTDKLIQETIPELIRLTHALPLPLR